MNAKRRRPAPFQTLRQEGWAAFVRRVRRSLRSRRKKLPVQQRALRKSIRNRTRKLGPPEAVIWIFGCQRSGTTFLERIFRQDLDSAVFGEFSVLTIGPRKTSLKAPEEVVRIVKDENARYAVIRTLFESDRAAELLESFPGSAGVWLFRDSRQVVASMKRKWGTGFFDISRKVESDRDGRWRLEETVECLRQSAVERFPEGPTDEAYALYWLTRNAIPFENGLADDPRMLFLSYNELVSDPNTSIRRILHRIHRERLWKGFQVEVRPSGFDRREPLNIAPETTLRSERMFRDLLGLSGGLPRRGGEPH